MGSSGLISLWKALVVCVWLWRSLSSVGRRHEALKRNGSTVSGDRFAAPPVKVQDWSKVAVARRCLLPDGQDEA